MVDRYAPPKSFFEGGFDPTDPAALDEIFVSIAGTDSAGEAETGDGLHYYIASTGSSTNSGTDASSPLRQPDEAIAQLPDGVQGNVLIECLDNGTKLGSVLSGLVDVVAGDTLVKATTTSIANSGAGASIDIVLNQRMTISGLANIQSQASVGRYIVITGAADPSNNGTFEITEVTDASTVVVRSGSAVGSDANNGSLGWDEHVQGNQLAGQTGAAATLSGLSGTPSQITVTGLTGMTASSVGRRLLFKNTTNALNTGSFEIITFNSATSVDVIAGLAVGSESGVDWEELEVPDFQTDLVPGDMVTISGVPETLKVSSVINAVQFRTTVAVSVSSNSATVTRNASKFKMPRLVDIKPGANGARITIVGNRDTAATFSSLTSVAIAGKYAQRRATSDGYAATVTDGSHWVERIGSTPSMLLAPEGGSVLASTTPDIDFVDNTGSIGTFADAYVHTLDTEFVDEVGEGGEKTFGQATYALELYFVGISFAFTTGLYRFQHSNFQGCRINVDVVLEDCRNVNLYAEGQVTTHNSNFSGILESDSLVVARGVCDTSYSVLRSNIGEQLLVENPESLAILAGVDMEGAVRGIRLSRRGNVRQEGDVSIENTAPSYLETFYGCQYRRSAGDVTGSTSGVCVTLNDGDLGINLGAAMTGTLSNSTTPGDEIVVGSAAVATFASLPAVDVVTLTRAT